MKQFFLSVCVLMFSVLANAQVDTLSKIIPTPPPAAPKKKEGKYAHIDLSNRANDHFLFQIFYAGWANKPDSINTKGFCRGFNGYLMFDFPFKTDPRFSIGIGAGVGTDNIYFDKTTAEVAGITPTLRFKDVSDTTHFKKYKLATTYLEAPIELRFAANPANTNKSFKVALGAKVGLLVNVHNKGKNLESSNGAALNNYIQKESSKRYFNNNRLVVTGRVGYGFIGAFVAYQVNAFIKEGAGPSVHPYNLGITISGL
jgi:hypothetical protein